MDLIKSERDKRIMDRKVLARIMDWKKPTRKMNSTKRTSNQMEAKCINENGLLLQEIQRMIGNGYSKIKTFKISVKWYLIILGVFWLVPVYASYKKFQCLNWIWLRPS
jgi:hypothetical protein